MYWFFSATAFFAGLLIGSFLNVLTYRGPQMWGLIDGDARRGDLTAPRSYCPCCRAPIKRIHLTPILGFAALGGKCASCGARISWRYPIVEMLGAAGGLGAFMLFGATPAALAAAVFFWALIALAVIDLETGYLPDAITLPLLLAGLAANAAGFFALWHASLIGAAAGYLIFRLIGEVFIRLRGIEGLGQGDAKLLAAIGAWLGWQALAPTVFVASLLGLAAVISMRFAGKQLSRDTAIPFGPALAAAGAVVMCLGPGNLISALP